MNILATYACPKKSAKFLDNKRCIKMILESAQLLSVALNLNGILAPYKNTHPNHPVNIWTRTSKANFLWLVEHTKALCSEYTKRYGKIHKSQQYIDFFEQNSNVLPDIGLTPFANCAANKDLGISFKSETDTHKAYRLYLRERWKFDKKRPKWR